MGKHAMSKQLLPNCAHACPDQRNEPNAQATSSDSFLRRYCAVGFDCSRARSSSASSVIASSTPMHDCFDCQHISWQALILAEQVKLLMVRAGVRVEA